jgi:hypothetical protein
MTNTMSRSGRQARRPLIVKERQSPTQRRLCTRRRLWCSYTTHLRKWRARTLQVCTRAATALERPITADVSIKRTDLIASVVPCSMDANALRCRAANIKFAGTRHRQSIKSRGNPVSCNRSVDDTRSISRRIAIYSEHIDEGRELVALFSSDSGSNGSPDQDRRNACDFHCTHIIHSLRGKC